MTTQDYLDSVARRYALGNATEHTFRGDLEQLLRHLLPDDIDITNEPRRIAAGAPDYVLMRRQIPVGYIEAKDVDERDLAGKKKNKEQFTRYKGALGNIVFTDYLDFHFYNHEEAVTSVRIGEVRDGKVVPLPEQYRKFEGLMVSFTDYVGQTLKHADKVAQMMANKARLLQDVIYRAVVNDDESRENTDLLQQYHTFRQVLIHDLSRKQFSDIYAQTIAYGMFAARYHDDTLEDFSRREAAERIPHSNPFLRKLFQSILGYDADPRLVWIVDELADIFRATDLRAMLTEYGRDVGVEDPIVHFYEDFLAAYDPALRKARGVWYTPAPVVRFIVRALDEVLQQHFGLAQGLADRATTTMELPTQHTDNRRTDKVRKAKVTVPRVQLLDPATGTGTFLSEVVRYIYEGHFEGMQGAWSGYVTDHLLPRLHGFELLMASYAMAHLKLDMLLTDTGYTPQRQHRLGVYLTNALEESHRDTGTLFASWLSEEAAQANRVKAHTPVMCVLGNPPYSGESSNKGPWIDDLMRTYKTEPGGTRKLQERNSKWLNDDYVKFLRYAQHYVERTGEGVVAFINPHGYLDNPTFRGMRWQLLDTYDTIYIIDLHGNSKKKETAPDGSADINVFDIQQGVCINLFVKTGKKPKGTLARVLHYDLYGKRTPKYDYLRTRSLHEIPFVELQPRAPMYYLIPKDYELEGEYQEGFSVEKLFPVSSVGIVTARDAFTIHETKEAVKEVVERFVEMEVEEARSHYKLKKDARDWKVNFAQQDLRDSSNTGEYVQINYRPFDTRWTYYTGNSKGFHCMPRNEVMRHMIAGQNLGLNWVRPMSSNYDFSISVSEHITDQCSAGNKSAGAGISYLGPLYLYPDTGELTGESRRPNLDMELVAEIGEGMGLRFEAEPTASSDTFAPIDLLDYIYAVLHTPGYRERYAGFLKTDFPRVPYPESAERFQMLADKGRTLRELHLLRSPLLRTELPSYPIDGDHMVSRKLTKTSPGFVPDGKGSPTGKVYINDTQYFEGVPRTAWEHYIGGYQPAQKWLKDRRGRSLTFEEIGHYRRIVSALVHTGRVTGELEEV